MSKETPTRELPITEHAVIVSSKDNVAVVKKDLAGDTSLEMLDGHLLRVTGDAVAGAAPDRP